MDNRSRLEELERQVRELTSELDRLRGGEIAAPPPPHEGALAHWVGDVRSGVGRVLGGSGENSFESRIGGVWLGRAAVLLMMTAIALGAATGVNHGSLAPGYRALIGYGLCLAALAYGLHARNRDDRFAMTILGAGLAGTYYITYATFFVDAMQLWTNPWVALLSLGLCLALVVGVTHWRRSQTASGIALFLIFYTVMAGCAYGRRAEDLVYALAACAALSIAAFWFHVAHRWSALTWGALLATYSTYILFFYRKPDAIEVAPEIYFGLMIGLLSLCFIMFSLTSLVDARRGGSHRRSVALLSIANSAFYVGLTWNPIADAFPHYECPFRLGLTLYIGLLAALAETVGPHRNRLYQALVAQVFVFLSLTLESFFSGAALLVALSGECLILALVYWRRGVVLAKLLNVCLIAIIFIGALFAMRLDETLQIGAYLIPENWFCAGGVAVVFALTAMVYERLVRRPKPHQRRLSGQWFLADTVIDLPGAALSMMHAAAAALILVCITVASQGDDPSLPYLLAAASVAFVIASVVLRTPQLAVAAMVPLTAAHVAFHFFLFIRMPGFEDQPGYRSYAILLAILTFLGAHFWERFLERFPAPRRWDHHAAAAAPYLLGTLLLVALVARTLLWIYEPLAYSLIGAALVLAGALFARSGIKAAGVLLLGIGAADFYYRIGGFHDAFNGPGDLPIYVGLLLITYACAERLLHLVRGHSGAPSHFEDALRTLLAAALGAVGVAALGVWAPPGYLTLCLLAHGLATLTLGALFREPRYRWAALCIFAIAVIRAYRFDLTKLPPLLQVLSFAGLALGLLAASWAYSRRRLRVAEQGKGAR